MAAGLHSDIWEYTICVPSMSNRSKWAHWNGAKRGRLIWLLLCFLPLCLSADAQDGKKPHLKGERDKGKEDTVAKLFETIRADAQLPVLIRITHRDDLEQTVCTVAQVGTLGNPSRAGFYKTAQPESISEQLNMVASFKEQRPANRLVFPRYSVAVWQVRDSQTGETQYWVGVGLYFSSLEEFMDNFTDQVLYKNGWKKKVAPQCRGK
jgi:hypothetical protein